MNCSRRLNLLVLALIPTLAAAFAAGTTPAGPARATPAQLESIQAYIKTTWSKLTRSNEQLATAAVDPKLPKPTTGRWPVYVSPAEDMDAIGKALQEQMAPGTFSRIELRQLPEKLAAGDHGLLYLPFPYVVPGGRFNEMYGWDSYFIQAGLIRDGQWDLAKSMADNFIYEIRNYGLILNANRTYYLTRSQPPFFTAMLLAVYKHTHDRVWLAKAVPELEKYYRYWISPPHLSADTGLSRYYDVGEGPAPESVASERDEQGRSHYERIREYFRTHEIKDYDDGQYYLRAKNQLTPLFYVGDRSMRESGFDPSNRFGPFNLDVLHYNPVCLNSLIYLMEKQASEIMTILGDSDAAERWRVRAVQRRDLVNKLLWDDTDGLYYDYSFASKKLRRYPFLTTFYPLWVGLADKEHAARVVQNLARFERPGGLLTSTFQSGNQWDAPFGWAPLQMIAVEGMRKYGYDEDANRITQKFLSLVLKDFLARGAIVEKYDVVRRATDVSSSIGFGYRTNVEGFGWTNAVFVRLLDALPEVAKPGVLQLDWAAKSTAASNSH